MRGGGKGALTPRLIWFHRFSKPKQESSSPRSLPGAAVRRILELPGGRRKLFVLSRASYLLLVLLSGPFVLHVLANRASQNKTLAGTSSEEVNLAPPPINARRLCSAIFARPAAVLRLTSRCRSIFSGIPAIWMAWSEHRFAHSSCTAHGVFLRRRSENSDSE